MALSGHTAEAEPALPLPYRTPFASLGCTVPSPLLTRPKGLANSRRWGLLKEEKQEGR